MLYEHHMNQTLEQGTLPGIKRDIVRKQDMSKVLNKFTTTFGIFNISLKK